MTPRDYLRSADLDGAATLGLRALSHALETLRARNADLHPAYLSDMTDDSIRATLPAVVRFACETCREWEADATKATAAAGHGHRDVAQLHRAESDDLDVVFGSRFLDERTRPTPVRRAVLRLAVAYTNLTTRTRLSDAHNGLRVLRRPVVERLRITQNRMAHASELVAQVGAMTVDGRAVRYAEEPVHILYSDYARAKGQSTWNLVNILVDLVLR